MGFKPKEWMQVFMKYHEVDCCDNCLYSELGRKCFNPDVTNHHHKLIEVEPTFICKNFHRREAII